MELSAARQDGLTNAMTGLGDDELDMRRHTVRSTYTVQRSVSEYEAEFAQNWMANREITQPSGDMFREGIELVDVEPKTVDLTAIKSWLEGDTTPLPDGSIDRTLGILHYAQRLWEQGPKVGGAALYPILDDGMDPHEPLDWRRIRRIVSWEVFDRSEIVPFLQGSIAEPEYYILTDVFTAGARVQPGQVIHKSRLFIHHGRRLGRREERLRNYWGDSWLELNWSARRAVEEGREYGQTYLDRSSWISMSIGELNELLQTKDPETGERIGERELQRRMRQFRRIARTLGIAVIDGGKQGTKAADGSTELEGRNPDKVESIVEGTGDLTKIVEMNRSDWQSGIGMPRSIAFGEQSSALRGGENTGDWQSWQGTISTYQKAATALVNWMLTLVFASRNGPTGGLIPTQWTIVWNPLIVPTPLEKAQIQKAWAEADNARIERDVARPAEVRLQRLVQGDVMSPLKASAASTELDTGLDPAQVGIATAILEGAQLVRSGGISQEFFAAYLQSIDERRFPPETADRIAARAAGGQMPTAAEIDAPAQRVNAATVMNAGSAVAQGKMAPEFFERALVTLDPEQFPPETAARLRVAAEGGAETLAAAVGELDLPDGEAMPLVESTDQAPDIDGDGIPDPMDDVLAAIPKDLMTPADIAVDIKARTGMDVSTQRVHSLAKRYAVGRGQVGSQVGYSLAGIKRALAADNGLTVPDESAADIGDGLAE